MNQSFFMVFLEGGNTPTFRHATISLAEIEAKRLSRSTGRKSFVLCSLKSFEISEFEIRDARPDIDDLPF